MASVGLPALVFQSAPRATPPPPTTTSVPLTYTDHKPPRPDISAASGNPRLLITLQKKTGWSEPPPTPTPQPLQRPKKSP